MREAIKGVAFACLNNRRLQLHRLPVRDCELYRAYSADSLNNKRFYNVGAGAFSHSYWTNVDLATSYYSRLQRQHFINYDLMAMSPLPLESASAEVIYTSHTIEHVSDEAVVNLVRECYRVLKPGGIFRITCPDIELIYAAYKRGDSLFFYWTNQIPFHPRYYSVPLKCTSVHQLFMDQFATPLAAISNAPADRKLGDPEIASMFSRGLAAHLLNDLCRSCSFNPEFPGCHINWWTHEKIIGLLRDGGFETVYRSGYGQSAAPPLRNTQRFDCTHPGHSLYVEGVR